MMNDEELQKKIEQGIVGESADEIAYRHVFRALENTSGQSVPPGFADRVIVRLEARTKTQRSSLEWLLAIFGGLSILVGLIVTIAMTGFKPDFGFLTAMKNYQGLFIFGILFILMINILDKQVLRRKEII